VHRGIEQVEAPAVLVDGSREPLRGEEQHELTLAVAEPRGLDPGQPCALADTLRSRSRAKTCSSAASRAAPAFSQRSAGAPKKNGPEAYASRKTMRSMKVASVNARTCRLVGA
jgi:hypothetical protein